MIKRLVSYYKKQLKNVENFKKNSEYMLPGKYTYDNTLTYIYLKDHETSNRIIEMFKNSAPALAFNQLSLKAIILFIMKIRFSKDLNIRDQGIKNRRFQGTAYLPDRKESGSKIFDLINNKVITFFGDKGEYNHKINSYLHFKQYFDAPNITENDKSELLLIEDYIESKNNSDWDGKDFDYVIEDIFERSIRYFRDCKKRKEYRLDNPLSFIDNISTENLISPFKKKHITEELESVKYPFIRLHGDLWTSNILININNDNDIYYIDWERSKDFIIFYDFFSLIWNEVYHKGNSIYLEKYMSGQYDEYFIEIFQIFEMSYKRECRKEYFSVFFLNYLNDWLDAPDALKYEYIYNKYEEIITGI